MPWLKSINTMCLRPLLLLAVFTFKKICLLLHLAQNLDWFDNTKSCYVTYMCEKYTVCFLPSLSNYDNENANTVQVCWQETQRVCQFSWLCTEGGRRTPWVGICFIHPKRAVLIQLSWKKLQHQCQLNQSPQLNQNDRTQNQTSSECYFFHGSRIKLIQRGNCSYSQKTASYHVSSHFPIITLKSLL